MESEFFGYRKGAFTGADADRDGFFQAANGGTLFLDEVADLPLPMQVKLLRAIQEKRVRKVGATQEDPVDVRIICATHQNLAGWSRPGRFRQDLYYRLNVIELGCRRCASAARTSRCSPAPSSQRLAAQNGGARRRGCRAAALEQLMRATTFPATCASSRTCSSARSRSRGAEEIRPDDLRCIAPPRDEDAEASSARRRRADRRPLQDYLDRVEREAILEALGKTGFNRTAAAKLLGITFRALRYRMERLGIKRVRSRRHWTRPQGLADRRAPRAPRPTRRAAGRRDQLLVVHAISLPPGEFGGDAIERLFTNCLDPQAHPYFREICGPEGVGAFPRAPRRRAGPVRAVRAARLARRRSRPGAAARAATTSRSASSSRAPRTTPSQTAQYAALLALVACAAAHAIRSARHRRPQRHRARAQDRSRRALRLAAPARARRG